MTSMYALRKQILKRKYSHPNFAGSIEEKQLAMIDRLIGSQLERFDISELTAILTKDNSTG